MTPIGVVRDEGTKGWMWGGSCMTVKRQRVALATVSLIRLMRLRHSGTVTPYLSS
jgi:hypothetical protein